VLREILTDGSWTVPGLALLALPAQLAAGAALGMGRRVPVAGALLMPVVVLLAGLVETMRALDTGLGALHEMVDPAWAPWFAIWDRSHAATPLGLAGLLATLLTFPPGVGAASAALREPRRGFAGSLTAGLGGMMGVVVGLAAGAAIGGVAWLVGAGLAVGALTALAASTLAATHPQRLTAAGIGVGGLILGAAALAMAGWAVGEGRVADLLHDFDRPFVGAGRWWDAAQGIELSRQALAVVVLPAVLAALPGVALLRPRRADAVTGADFLGVLLLVTAVFVGAGWVSLQRATLGSLAGRHAAAVLRASPGYDVPRLTVLPARVYVADPQRPRWLALKDRGGVEVQPLLPGVGAPIVRRGDGLILPAGMSLEDVYLALSESDAGEVGVVGCTPPVRRVLDAVEQDPLLAVGRCGAFPLRLRVTDGLMTRRTLIQLRGRELDDGGDIIGVDGIGDVSGQDVVLRGQVDATVADLVATLRELTAANRVFLGWGVDLDGEDIAVGVDPDLWLPFR
jgi:hypothetical protein